MRSASRPRVNSLSRATSVVFRCADRAMSMREEREANFALNAKPDTSALKVGILGLVLSLKMNYFSCFIFLHMDDLIGSARVEGDDDEEDIDDIEHEFNMDEQTKNTNIVEAMLHGKMSYGRGPDDDDDAQYPPVIAGGRSRPVRTIGTCFYSIKVSPSLMQTNVVNSVS